MTPITCRLAQQRRTVMRHAFGQRRPGPTGCFTANAGTLTVKANGAAVVEHRTPAAGPFE